jgi:hypothetical protein
LLLHLLHSPREIRQLASDQRNVLFSRHRLMDPKPSEPSNCPDGERLKPENKH